MKSCIHTNRIKLWYFQFLMKGFLKCALALEGKVWVRTGGALSNEEFSSFVTKTPPFTMISGEEEGKLFFRKRDLEDVKRNFFGEYSFSETVGLWLEKGDSEASNLLSPFISTEGFSFSPAEYLDLQERLRVALRRYEKLPAVSNGLEDLNTGFFRHRSLEESTFFIEKHLREYLKRGEELHRRYLLEINSYARSRASEKRQELRARAAALEALAIKTGTLEKLKGRIQKKTTAELSADWLTYQRNHLAVSEDKTTGASPEHLHEVVNKELESVNSAFRFLGRELKTDGLSLNALTVNASHGDAQVLRELENLLNELQREVDEAGLYQLPLRLTDAATTPRQLQQLGSLLDKLRNTERHLGELPMFYDRRHFWYAQPAHLRRLLAPLLELPPQDWEVAFSSWYFERCLEREQRPERFYREVNQSSNEKERGDGFQSPGVENLIFLSPEEPWPQNTEPNDLFLDLGGATELPEHKGPRAYSVAALSDESAIHFAVSGYRDPILVFSQSFQLLYPPKWRICKVESPPVGPKNSVLLQLSASTPWLSLREWNGQSGQEINVFLPEVLSSSEEEVLLGRWELLISRASAIRYFHALTPNSITQGLLSDGFNGAFLTSALLRAAEAAEVEPFDHEALIAIGNEVRLRCGLSDPPAHPLAEQFGSVLAKEMPDFFIENHVPWRDTFLPLVLQSPQGKKTVLLPDGRLPGLADDETERARHRELKIAGFQVLGLNALSVWEDLEGEVKRITLALGKPER